MPGVRLVMVVIATMISGCGLEQTLSIELPDLAGVESMIVSVEQSGALYVYAEDLRAGAPLTVARALPPRADARIDMLAYSVPLEEMEISPGQLRPVESDPRRALPTPLFHFVSHVERGVVGGAAPGEPDDALASFRIAGTEPPPPTSCFQLTADPIDLLEQGEESGFEGFALALSATVALVGTPSAELFEVTLDGAQRVAVQPAGVAISAGAVDQSGRLWFGDRQGSLWRGVLRGALSLELVATSTMGGIDVLAVGELAGGEVEAFAVVRPGTLIRFDGSAWAGLHDMCRTELCTDKYGYRLQRLGPGEAVAMRFKAVKMVHHREGRTIELAIPHTDPSSLHARCLENVAGFGIAVGIEGQVLRFDPAADAWQDELVVLPGFDVYSVASFRGAFVLEATRARSPRSSTGWPVRASSSRVDR